MAIRLVERTMHTDIHFDSGVQEYRVSYPAYRDMKKPARFDATAYFTDDRLDAIDTAAAMDFTVPEDILAFRLACAPISA